MRSTLVIALGSLALMAPMSSAHACSCIHPDPAALLASGDFVFIGSIIDR